MSNVELRVREKYVFKVTVKLQVPFTLKYNTY